MLTVAELTKHVAEKRVMPPEAWGHPGWLASTELLSLETLRHKAAAELFQPEHMMGDRALLRFLRARKFDSSEAFKMLQKDLEWRRVFEGRIIRGQETPAVVDFCRQGFLHRSGFDKDGRPLLTIRFRYAFPRNIKDMNEIVLFWVAYVQQVTDECEKLGKTDFSVIGDLDGFSPTSNFSLAMVKVLIDILQNHYPERLGFLLILNLPMAFRMGWNLIQPFLDERTRAKIHVLGKDAKLLKEYIPVDQLEQHYGGTHAPYPFMDDFVEGMLASGVVVHTGFFPPQFQTADNAQQQQLGGKKFSSTGLDRIRTIMLTTTPQQGAGEAIKASEVPKTHPRVAVFGANGRTGMEIVKRFLQHTEYDVVAFIRLHGSGVPPQMLQFAQQYGRERFSIIVGDCMNYNDLDRAIEMSDAVVSCMGASARSGGGGDGDAEFYEKTARALVDSMQRNGTKRIVVVTAAQARRMSTAWWDSNATLAENSMRHLYWGAHFKYVAEMEKFIQNERDISYTFLRPAHLDDDSISAEFEAEQDQFFLKGAALSRVALARCIVDDCVLGNKYVNCGVALAGRLPVE